MIRPTELIAKAIKRILGGLTEAPDWRLHAKPRQGRRLISSVVGSFYSSPPFYSPGKKFVVFPIHTHPKKPKKKQRLDAWRVWEGGVMNTYSTQSSVGKHPTLMRTRRYPFGLSSDSRGSMSNSMTGQC